jgi:hypothetical protein
MLTVSAAEECPRCGASSAPQCVEGYREVVDVQPAIAQLAIVRDQGAYRGQRAVESAIDRGRPVAGKPGKVAVVAAMRKLLAAVWSVAIHRQPFVPRLPPIAAPASGETKSA